MSPAEPIVASEPNSQSVVEQAPLSLFSMFSDTSENNRLGTGLIFTRSHVVAIKKYTSTVRKLPLTLEDVSLLDAEVTGFETAYVQRVFDNLRTHANIWDLLEDNTKRLSAQLNLFSDSFISEGEEIIKAVKATAAFAEGGKKLSEIWENEVSYTPVQLGAEDKEIFQYSIRLCIEAMRNDLGNLKVKTQYVCDLADDFRDRIEKNFVREIGLLVSSPKKDYSSIEAEARSHIDELDKRIAVRAKEYEQFVNMALDGLKYFLVGALVTGSMYGPKAEVVRKAKNQLIAERDREVEKLNKFSPMVKTLESLRSSFLELDTQLKEASTAAGLLKQAWLEIDTFLENSLGQVDSISSDMGVALFTRKMLRAIQPWKRIGPMAAGLSQLFNETLEEIKEVVA